MPIQQIMRNRDKNSKDFKNYEDFDSLGLSDTKDRMVKILESVTPPLTIGLYGEWGSGKTEMIHGIIDDLEKDDKKYLTLYFDAWEYRKEDNIALAVLSKMHNNFCKDKNPDAEKQSIDVVEKLRSTYCAAKGLGGLLLEGGMQYFSAGEKDLDDLKQAWIGAENYFDYVDDVEKLKSNYKNLIDKVLDDSKKEKIFIFIDNLDRCLPDVVVNLLENISIFLSYQDVKCVYTLAMDKEHVVKAIKHLYKDFEGDKYLEKIIHVDLYMPVGEATIVAFVKKYTAAFGQSKVRMMKYAKLENFLKHAFCLLENKGDDSNASPLEKFSNSLDEIETLFIEGELSNPRRSEKIIRQLSLWGADSRCHFIVLLFLLCLREFFPAIYFSLDSNEDIKVLQSLITQSTGFTITGYKMAERAGKNTYRNILVIKNAILRTSFIENDFFRGFLGHFNQWNANYCEQNKQIDFQKEVIKIKKILDK